MEKIYSKETNRKSGILTQLLMMLALVLCALTGHSQACSLVSTLPCSQVRVDLPYVLDFSGSQGGLADRSGVGTGFTMADPPSAPLSAPSNPAVPGYEPSLLQIVSGRLQVTTTAGITYLQPSTSARTNSQVNALGVGLKASAHKNSVEVTLLQPPAGSNKSEQAGIWFGLDENNYIKLDVMSWSGGTNVVEMRREVNGLSAQNADRIATGGMSLSSSTIRLRMLIDNATNSVEGFYTVNGGKEVRLGSLSIPASFIAGKTLSDGSTTGVSFAGILATHRNATAPLTYAFDDFRVTPVDAGILSFAPTALSFSVEQGTAAETQSAVLSANQGAPLVTLSKSTNSDWLVLPASASPGSLPFSVNTDGLPAGTYQATVTASAPGYTPATLQVNLTVSAPPTESTLSWSPTALNFSVVQEGGTASQSSTLSANQGLPTVSLSKSAGSNWLILPASPVLGPLSFSVDATGLAIGAYTATVTASASGYTDAVLQVKLDVTSTSSTKSILFTHTSQSMEVRQGSTEGLLNYIYTSDNTPVSARLTAADESGNLPTWLSVNGSYLNGIPYTTGSEISFDFDATTLSVGTYKATVTASASGYADAMVQIQLIVTTESNTTQADYKVNFQDGETPVPAGWLKDYGQAFGLRSGPDQGRGLVYGWKKASGLTPVDLTLNGRNRNTASDVVLNTFMHMQMTSTNTGGTPMEALWEAEVPNGNYDITVSVGDASYIDSKHSINVEGFSLISQFVPTEVKKHASATITVTVADGYLTLDATGGTNTKINSVIITPSTSTRPYVKAVSPMQGSEFVSVNTSVSTDILSLPNGGVNNTTLSSASVKLKEVGSNVIVSGHVNGTGGGDAITLVPQAPLKSNTLYRFEITSDVKDLSGASFIPYASTFKTGDVVDGVSGIVTFERTELPNTAGRHTSLSVGPDGKLYASTIDGKIKRFTIKADGTLEAPQIISSLGSNRMIVGLAFDPASTAENLIAWVTHSTSVFINGPEWDGKLTKLSGQNLEKVQDVLINLPRSVKDHLTNSIAFGPDGALYFTQGSNSAMGRADGTWGNREDNQLSAAVLRLNVSGLSGLSLPINVKTSEGGGTYNPFAANAPLTIYASGVRNAYDLVWHSNGKLYVPTNGSAAGGNTPASVAGTSRVDGSSYSGPSVPALTDVNQTMRDYLFRVEKGGYYGHPNPLRGEYVMNGGNPTSSGDLAQVHGYPIGIKPDANWRGFAFDFNSNKSPNGIIEYKGNAFEGALKGKLMVVRYSQNDDIIILEPGSDFDIAKAIEGLSVPGFSGFYDPLDLTEDVRTGFIYVSEYGGDGRISLVKPKEIHRGITLSTERIIDNDVVDSNLGQNHTVTVSNTGSSNIVVSGISLAGNSPGQYVLSGLPAFPKTIGPGSNFVFNVAMKASSTGLKTALVQVASNDEKKPTVTVELRGLGTSGLGGTNEPSLQAILNVHGIPVNVGDDNANTNIIHSSTTQQKAALLGEEVNIQIFQKAGAGNVTIEPLSVFGPTATNPIVGFGWYKEGDPTAKNEVFTVSNSPASNGQTVVVNTGAPLAFDPASATFGFYSRWPFFDDRHLYSEDRLNTFSGSIPHHVRVYPLKDNSGKVVTNAYIIAFEEHTSGFDYQDLVFIARNVKPATPVGSANSFRVNFQPATATIPEGYAADTGLAYDETRGFGWIDQVTKAPKANDLARLRNTTDEPRLRTLNHLQHSSNPTVAWEYEVANGAYQVTVSAGDPSYLDSKHTLNVEGVAAIIGFVPTSAQKFKSGTVTVTVSDGKLTIDAAGGTNTKINFIIIDPIQTDPIQSPKINFQPTASAAPEGYAPDTGLAYDEARGFGWIDGGTKLPKVNDLARERSTADEPRLRTLNHLQHSSNPKAAWEYKVANGTYQVTVSAGDPDYLDSKHTLNVEGVAAITGFVPTSTQKFKSGTVTVAVSDGKLTINAAGGTNTKINYVIISPADSENDHTPPAVALKLTGTLQAQNTYGNKVEISIEASDTGGSGLASTQYSLNGEAYQNYTAPLLINTLGNYTIRAKAVDGNANETVTEEVSFSVVEQVASNALLFVENRDKFPANDHLTFSRIQVPHKGNANHDLVTLRIHNKGASSLLINELILSNPGFFKIETLNNAAYDPATSLPVTLGSKAYTDLTLRFIATDQGTRVKVLHETLTIRSNDDKSPEKQVFLHGLWQYRGEGGNEPYAKEIIDAFGFKTNTGYGSVDPDKGNPDIGPKGDEVRSPYFVRADPSKPVYVRQMAAYHGCCTQTERLKWYPKGGTGTTQAVYHTGLDGQTLLPRASATGTTPSEGSFSPSGAFGMVIGADWTDPTKNPNGLIGVKVWKAKDAKGNVIPNAYIIANDYLGTDVTNYDYNDNMYYVTNVRPETGTAHYAALSTSPSALDFGEKLIGSSTPLTLNLTSLGEVYSDGSQDPDLQISSVQIVGENASEFTAEMPVKAVLGPQESTTLTVKFNPVQQGFKVADLLIHYNSGASPHRVPLYGVALGQGTTVIVHQRINSGSATAVTVNGKTWKADNQYASGRLEPYTNPRVTQVSATDEDAIYLTEQSSGAENAPFQYEIPVSSNGEYVVRLHFAEIYWGTSGGGSGGAGSRVFSIGMEGQPRLVNLDVVQEVGSASAIVRNFPVTVSDGKLSINFTASVNRPMVAAVEVYSLRTSTSTVQAIRSTGGTDFDGISEVKVYPNPLQDRFSIDFPREYEGNVSLTIVDPAGRSIKVGDYRLEPGARTLEVNIAHLRLNRGFYYLKVESENQLGGVIKLLVK